jgi:hypothetical protein
MFSALFGSSLAALAQPATLLLILLTFGVTLSWSRVSAYFETKAAVQPWEHAVATRDAASKEKDAFIVDVAKQRETDNAEIENLRQQIAEMQAQISLATDEPCRWGVHERQLLNAAGQSGKGTRK